MNFRTSQKNRGYEAGEGLVSVIVAVSLLAVIIGSVAVVINSLQRARRQAAMSEGARDLEAAIVQVLSEKWTDYVKSGCSSATPSTVGTIDVGSEATLDSRASALSSLSAAFSTVDADFDRCSTKATRINGASDTAATAFYRCYKLSIDSSQFLSNNKDSIVHNKGAFLQLIVNIKDFGKDTASQCGNLSEGAGFGLEVYYMTKWIMKINNEKVIKTQVGSFNVSL